MHALRESIEPVRTAFATEWPEASTFNLLDDSLSDALARARQITPAIMGRFIEIGRYAVRAPDVATQGILFTCSAFGPAIDAVRRDLTIPVHTPTESAFAAVLERGARVGLLVTFAPSLPALTRDLEQTARQREVRVSIRGELVPGALAALERGDAAEHDARIVAAAAALEDCEVILLGQFSMARARRVMEAHLQRRVLTTPECAVAGLRRVLKVNGVAT